MKIDIPIPIFKGKLTQKLTNKISKSFRYNIIIDKAKEHIDSIIILGNGNIDDLAIPIVCHHLNGNKIVEIVKPDGRKRIETISGFPTYVSGNNIDKIALIMDQEEENLDEIYKRIEHKLMDQNILFEIIMENSRVKQYRCMCGSKQFDFILIISGLDNIATQGHKIEDHLINGALKLSKISNANLLQDSKDTWNSIDAPLQKEILNYFVNNRVLSSEVFPQHFNGLQLLEGS
jgi:hypothetical protein